MQKNPNAGLWTHFVLLGYLRWLGHYLQFMDIEHTFIFLDFLLLVTLTIKWALLVNAWPSKIHTFTVPAHRASSFSKSQFLSSICVCVSS